MTTLMLGGWAASLFLAAAPAQQGLTLAEALRQTLAAHPELAGAERRIDVGKALRVQAGLRPNPALTFQIENLRGGGTPPFSFSQNTDTYAFLRQPFETAGKRERRVELVTAQERIAGLERDSLRRQILARVRAAYWAAAGAQRTVDLLRENLKTFHQIVEYHEARVKEGAMAESDLLRVRLEAERFGLDVNNALLEAERARIELFRVMGAREFPRIAMSDPLDVASGFAVQADAELAMSARPERQLAVAHVDAARSSQRLQLALRRPNLTAIGGYKHTAGFSTAMAGLEAELPVFNRNQGNVAAAAAEIQYYETNLAAVEALIRAEVGAAEAAYRVRRTQVTETLPRARAQAADNARIAIAAYREGGADLLRLLDAQRLRIDTELLNLRAQVEYRQSIVALQAAMGVVE